MKNTKRKSLIKSARKTAKKNILVSLIAELKKVSANIGAGSQKLEKVIEKGSGKLAKKVAKEIMLDEVAIVAAGEVEKTAEIPVTKKGKVKAAPADKADAVKEEPVALKNPDKKASKKKAKTTEVVTAS
ncbi:hypothetical protein [Mucilaginibacter gracilis]|nr:hypothetical protein [Mucilaginibacter gracilis]